MLQEAEATMRILALIGWSHSGKDTTADILEQIGYKRYAFATPLKDIASTLFQFPRELADTQEGKQSLWRVGYTQKTIRQILLDFARLDRQRFGDGIYAEEIVNQISQLPDSSQVVITDLRYPIELETLQKYQQKMGCELYCIRVLRQGQTESPVNDPSEHYLEAIDAIPLVNPGTSLNELKGNVGALCRKLDELSNSQNKTDGTSGLR